MSHSPDSCVSLTENYSVSTESCEICGDKVHNRRYGASSCLGCTVFFRRSCARKTQYKCSKNRKCFISSSYRSACRYCRFQKCLEVGLKESRIQKRDSHGPRKHKNGSTPEMVIVDDQHEFLPFWVAFQRVQFKEHFGFFADNGVALAFHRDQWTNKKSRRRARAQDVSVMFKLSLQQALDWGNRLKPFQKLSWESKKSVLAEYCLAFLLIDQGFLTSKEKDEDIWVLQNGTFMHPDCFIGLPGADVDVECKQVEHHQSFVSELIHCFARPFRKLDIDEVECAALKTILIMKPSCSRQAVYSRQESDQTIVFTKCMEELMEHSEARFPGKGAERFGEIILLISMIRCGVKTIYNQTRVSDLMNHIHFDPIVRDILLT